MTTTILPTALTSARDMVGIPVAMAASYWDEKSQLIQDYVIIGGGIIGLSTALSPSLLYLVKFL